jgi:hypothetical protein
MGGLLPILMLATILTSHTSQVIACEQDKSIFR